MVPVLAISPGATNFTAQGAAIVVDPNLTLTISDGSDLGSSVPRRSRRRL